MSLIPPQIVQFPERRHEGAPRFLKALDQSFEAGHAAPSVGDRVFLGRELLMEQTRDGVDYTRVCGRHQWASLPFYTLKDILPQCPECAAEIDGGRGRERYRSLHLGGAA